MAARLEAIDAFEGEILENTSSWSVESLAVCRHENAPRQEGPSHGRLAERARFFV